MGQRRLPNIAITGKMRSGKDEVAKYLVSRYGYTRFAFADELKRYYHELFGRADAKPREGYQWFGQVMRERDPDIWVRKCFDAINRRRYYCLEHEEDEDNFRCVISDLRQPIEYDRCRKEGFIIVRVNCPDHIRLARARKAGDAFTEEDMGHETEQRVDNFKVDFEIDNGRTLDETYRQIDNVMRSLTVAESQVYGNDCPNGMCDV
jgi:dephospho-CoA kinase